MQRWIVGVPGGFDLFVPSHMWVEIFFRLALSEDVRVNVPSFLALHHGLIELKDLHLDLLDIQRFALLSANHTVNLLHELIDALLDD